MRKEIYNLEFRSDCHVMTIFEYRFVRVDDYQDKIASLQHLVTFRDEFQIHANTGKHAVTAYVDLPKREEKSILKQHGSDNAALSDILLLLSLFTGRDVFTADDAQDGFSHRLAIADPRVSIGELDLATPSLLKRTPYPATSPLFMTLALRKHLIRCTH